MAVADQAHNDALEQLDRAATQAANAGRWDEADRLWMEVLSSAPSNRNALWGLGFSALQRGDGRKAKTTLKLAHDTAPQDKMVLLTLAMACRECGDLDAEETALTKALTIDPYYLPGLLAKAAMLERIGHAGAAAAFGNAITVAGDDPVRWPPEFRVQLQHAKDVSEQQRRGLFGELSEKLDAACKNMPLEQQQRWREAASVMAKLSKPYHSESNQLLVPRLPATTFYDRSLFPWAEAVEAKTDLIRAELLRTLESKQQSYVPYINKDKGAPVNQWAELNHSKRWSVLHLWAYGEPVEENLALCPETAKVLALVDQAKIAGNCPNAMFSALAPHTRIPPHRGETNARLVVHLPLIVPEKCGGLRVGFDTREWKVGELMVFDDSIEHEAWNDSDELRVVLIFDAWNPHLSLQDREMVNLLTTSAARFRA